MASWNMRWLDSQSERPESLRRTADYQAMANTVKQLDADVIAFQEVADEQSLSLVMDMNNDALSSNSYRIELSTRQLHSKSTRSGVRWEQYVGFAIRSHIAYYRNPDLIALDTTKQHYLRYGVDITLLDNTRQPRLRLLTVHLKSGCFSAKSRKKSCTQLKQQFESIEHWVEKRYKEKQPFIVLGDFNRHLTAPNDWLWRELNDGFPFGLTLYAATSGQKSNCTVRRYSRHKKRWFTHNYRQFIDHMIMGSTTKSMMVNGSFKQHEFQPSSVSHFNTSDHCPIKATFNL
ncbi:endonuclease/exonuclease/phosphatase family protein [Photobacterium minamisatsumaniensis]|uniref:endonuclease/exonuclease/phosphatase family protein n=1 Tax=Photobacterium minamisatsumaniensis TaxID=2910233 RepID=UPI003D0F3EDD